MRKKVWVCLPLVAVLVVAVSDCGSKSSPTQPTPEPCTYTLSASSLTIGADGGSESITVTTASHCTWTAASDRAWMVINSGASGTGTGVVAVSVTANTGAAERSGTLTIAGQAVPVKVGGVTCTIDLAPASASFSKDGTSGQFSVTAAETCEWTAASRVPWITVTLAAGRGNGTVAYSVERNRELTNRTGAIAVGERLFSVTQEADTPPAPVCEYSVAPIEFSPCMPASTITATMTTRQGCTWTAEPDAPWLAVTTGQSGTGPGVITLRVNDNYDAPRQSVVKVRWPTVTAGQNLRVSQAGCRYAVSINAIAIAAAGGPGRFDVLQQSEPNTCGGPLQNGCVWTAVADASWITITTRMPQAGDNPVSFTVAPNDNVAARSGSITVKGQVVRITQAGR